MKYVELKEALKDFTVFSLNDIKRIDGSFYRVRLNEWQNKGYIKKIIKGYYIFSDLELNENVLFEIANRIYSPSYISFEMALSYYRLIPEGVYVITSTSSRRTYKFETPIAEYTYKTIKPQLFFGYNLVKYDNKFRSFQEGGNKYFKIAGIEKAVLDYFYINSDLKKEGDFANIRINKDMFFKQVNKEKLHKFLEKFAQKTLTKRIRDLWEFMKNA